MYEIGRRLLMKKPHPCGGKEWTVVRLGAEVKIQCNTCGRFVNLTRDDLKKRVKAEMISTSEKEEK